MITFLKNYIKKYLKKRLDFSHPKNYLFLRWLADVIKDKSSTDYVCANVASWLVNTDHSYLYVKFHDLFVIDNTIYIYTLNPGMWIGKHGTTIDSLTKHINTDANGQKLFDYNIHLIEMENTEYSHIIKYATIYSDF